MTILRRLALSPGVFLREVDDHLVAEKPGLRVRIRDRRAISILKHASSGEVAGEVVMDSRPDSADDSELLDVVELLTGSGLLESGDRAALERRPDRTNDYLVSLRGRYAADLVEGVRHRLAEADVVIVGDPWMGGQIVRALEGSGVGRSRLRGVSTPPVDGEAAPPRPLDLIVDLTWPTGGTTAGAAGGEVAVLPAIWNGEEIVVGPVLEGGVGRCRGCCGPHSNGRDWVDAPRAARSVGSGIVSAAVLSYLGGLHPCEILTTSVRYDLRTGQSDLALPRGDMTCPGCGVPTRDGETPHATAQRAWTYEKSVEIPMGRVGRVEQWLSVRNQSIFRRRHFNMPPLRHLAEAHGAEIPGQLLSLLGMALEADVTTSHGKVSELRYRRLPTVEGIGTASVYALPLEQCALLGGGAHYDPYEGDLFPLRWPVGDRSQPTTGFSLCVTGNFTAAEVTFGRFGRRVVLHDAGFLLAQLLHSGSQLGLRPAVPSDWSTASARSVLDLAAGEDVLAILDLDAVVGDEAGSAQTRRPPVTGLPSNAPSTFESWFGTAMATVRQVAPSVVDGLVLYCWDGDEELSEVRVKDGAYAGRTRVQQDPVPRAALRGALSGIVPGDLTFVLIGADLQTEVCRHGATAYASLIQRAAALAHLLSSAADEMGIASRLLLKVPARLLEQSTAGKSSRHRILSALVTGRPDGTLPGSSRVLVDL
ncbi:hypothetical protein [Plantactinospora sp. B5E13]|uniref:hypothetical protein n=1 Tax=Plantactinospora sp. B5E13 TaxID=3153758 RepID=UPI00325EC552